MKVLMGLIALRVMAASLAHSRLGPKTTARLVLVILFWSERAETCVRNRGRGGCAAAGNHRPRLPRPATESRSSGPHPTPGERERESHLHQEGSEETQHQVVLLGQRSEGLQRRLHSLTLVNVCAEWGPGHTGSGSPVSRPEGDPPTRLFPGGQTRSEASCDPTLRTPGRGAGGTH